jgi:penicillin-binding protein 2
MLDSLWNKVKEIGKSRLLPVSVIFFLLFFLLVRRIFVLQVIEGQAYQNQSVVRDEKTRYLKSTRGNIYDRNGELLAYDELSYSVTVEDIGTLSSNEEKNSMIYELIQIIESHGDTLDSDFSIVIGESGELEFTVEGNTLTRFKKDVFSLSTNEKLSSEQEAATAQDIYDYIRSDKSGVCCFNISESYSVEDTLKIMSIRFSLFMNRYKSWIPSTVATDLEDKTVAAIKESSAELPGVEIVQETHRVYNDSKYFAHILGYTGTVTTDELEELKETGEDEKYTDSDQIGKTGLEKEYESYLHGTKGEETVLVNENNKVVQINNRTEATAGNDLYLTIDAKLQKETYDILEKKIASILYAQINNGMDYGSKGESANNIKIPIYEVYNALIENNVINIKNLDATDATNMEKQVAAKFQTEQESALRDILAALKNEEKEKDADFGSTVEEYLDYVYSMLKENEVLLTSSIDTDNTDYKAYAKGKITLRQFLNTAISNNWIDLTKLSVADEFYSTEEIYEKLLTYIEEALKKDTSFTKKVYRTMIFSYKLTGQEICILLFDQGVLEYDEAQVEKLSKGTVSAYNFLREQIKNLKITPAQLALEPCSGSAVVTDPDTGEVLALVSYPGYDNNKFANRIDAEYFTYLNESKAYPLLNRPLQQLTAPGSTFKMVSATAALSTGVLQPTERVNSPAVFDKVDKDNPSKCWKTSGSHGNIDVTDAIGVSCNYFFYEMGYRMSLKNGVYNSEKGLKTLAEYAKMYGLDTTSGIELYEYEPQISNTDSVRSAIGQGTNNYTPAQLARYVTTIANEGTCYNLTVIGKVTDLNGDIVFDNQPTVYNQMDISTQIWGLLKSGMNKVVNGKDSSISYLFKNLSFQVAGKTGTAQESKSHPNHALFVSFAPYENPEIAVTVVIPNGYTSANAAAAARDIYKYYFKDTSSSGGDDVSTSGQVAD